MDAGLNLDAPLTKEKDAGTVLKERCAGEKLRQ